MYRMMGDRPRGLNGFGLGAKKDKGGKAKKNKAGAGMTQVLPPGVIEKPIQMALDTPSSSREQKALEREAKAFEKANQQTLKQQQKDLAKEATAAWKEYCATLDGIDRNLRRGNLPFDTPLPAPPAYDSGLVPSLEKKAKNIVLNRIPAARQIAQTLAQATIARSTMANYAGGYLPQPGSGNPGRGDSSGKIPSNAQILPTGEIVDAGGNVIGNAGGGGGGGGSYSAGGAMSLVDDQGQPLDIPYTDQGAPAGGSSKTLLYVGGAVVVGLVAWMLMKRKKNPSRRRRRRR